MNALREKARATASAVAAKASAASEVAMEKAKTEAVRTRPSRPSPRASPSVAHIRLLTGVPTTPPRDVTSVPPSSLPAPHQATAKAYVAEKREELRPKLRAAMEKAEPSLREFMRSPQAKYLRENPKAVAAVCMLLAGVGIPGAASMLTLVNMMGPMEALFPLVLMMVQPLAEMGVDAA